MTELYKDYYKFYQSFHSNKLNKLVHILCIPLLVWSFFGLSNHAFNAILPVDFMNLLNQPATIIYLNYMAWYYVIAPKKIAHKTIFFYLIILIHASKTYWTMPTFKSLYLFLYVHVTSWICQILSHKFIEKNSPALITGIKQSFLTAPIFVVDEIHRDLPKLCFWPFALAYMLYLYR